MVNVGAKGGSRSSGGDERCPQCLRHWASRERMRTGAGLGQGRKRSWRSRPFSPFLHCNEEKARMQGAAACTNIDRLTTAAIRGRAAATSARNRWSCADVIDPEQSFATVSEHGRSRSDSGSSDDAVKRGRNVGDVNGFTRLGKSMTKQARAVFR